MYCNNCGKTIDDSAAFCTNCGRKLEAQPPVTMAEQTAAEEAVKPEEAVTAAEAISETEQPNGFSNGFYEKTEPVQPFVPAAVEKTYFGKGALAFCLVIIGLLAISTGVFAGLYFSVI